MALTKDLDASLDVFSEQLDKACALVIEQHAAIYEKPGYAANNPLDVSLWFDEALPDKGIAFDQLLSEVKDKVIDSATMNMGPHMYGYVNAGGTQVSTIAELIAATINQNCAKWHLSPAMSEIEKRVAQWGAEFIGYKQASDEQVGGVLVSGGSAANLTSLTVARNMFFEKHNIREAGLFGHKPFIVYGSNETHGCVDKSVELLGIGTDHYRKIECNKDFTLNLEALETQIEKDKAQGFIPFCVIGNAGTVNTGAIDDLNAIADIANTHKLWFHVDGAYGGLAAALDSLKKEFSGIERADSVAIDFHKWLYQPFEAGCTLVKNWDQLNRSYYKKASYLSMDTKSDGRFDFNEHHFALSRNAKAFKVWMSFKAYGAERLKAMIQKDIDLTKYLADLVKKSKDFKLFNNPDLSAVCFQYLADGSKSDNEINELNQQLLNVLEEDGRVFITGTKIHGHSVIRACLINHRKQKEHVEYLLNVIRELGQKLV